MKKLTLAFAIAMVLVVSAVAFVPSQPAVTSPQGAIPKSAMDGLALFVPQDEKPIPLTIVDKRKRPVKEESLSPEQREQIARVKKAAESIRAPNMAGIVIKVHCSFPPLRCTIDVIFAA